MSDDDVLDIDEEEKKQRVKEKNLADQAKNDLYKILSSPEGKRFYKRILDETGLYNSSFSGELTHDTAFRCGKRKIGLWLLEEGLNTNPEAMFAIIIKNKTREK